VHILHANVDEGEDEGGQGEGAQAQRGRITKLAASGGFVETWLELTTESREPRRIARVGVGQGISAIVKTSALALGSGLRGVEAGGVVEGCGGAVLVLLGVGTTGGSHGVGG